MTPVATETPGPATQRLAAAIAAAAAAPKALAKDLAGEEPPEGAKLSPKTADLVAAFRDAARQAAGPEPWTALRGLVTALRKEPKAPPAALSLARLALAEARRRAGQDDAAWGGLAQRWELELPALRYAAAMDQLDAAMKAQIPKEMLPPLDVLLELEPDPARRQRWQELRDAQHELATTRWRWGLPIVAVLVIGSVIAMNREAVQSLGGSVLNRIRRRTEIRET